MFLSRENVGNKKPVIASRFFFPTHMVILVASRE
jgi:hypothetical protein